MTVQMYCTRSPSIDFRIRLRVDYVDALHRLHRSLIVNSIFNTSVVISFNLHRHLCCYEQVFSVLSFIEFTEQIFITVRFLEHVVDCLENTYEANRSCRNPRAFKEIRIPSQYICSGLKVSWKPKS